MPEADHLKEVCQKILEIFKKGDKECLVTVIDTLGQEQVSAVREGQEMTE